MTLPSRIYYDVLLSNLDNKQNRPEPAVFSQTRNTPFIQDPSKYFLSIVRWTLDTSSLPIFVPMLDPRAGNGVISADATIYSITLQYGDVISRAPVLFIPQDKKAEVPLSPFALGGIQNNNQGYYYVYSYAYVIFLINNCYQTAFDELIILAAAAGTPIPVAAVAPFLTFTNSTQTAFLTCSNIGFGPATVGDKIDIYFNTSLAGLFSSFPYEIEFGDGQFGKNFKFILDIGVDIPLTDDIFIVESEYSTISVWNPVISISVMSNNLGVIQNVEGKPTLYYNNTLINGSGNNSVSSNLITDFVADVYVPNIIYVPTAEYRRIELVGNTPLSNLDLAIFWKNRIGQLQPFLLPVGGSCSIKLMFELKDAPYK
jgi:hypothetical protein